MKVVLCIVTWLILAAMSVDADEYRPAYLELKQVSPDTFSMLWKSPLASNNKRLLLDVKLPNDVKIIRPERSSIVGGAVISHSTISRAGGFTGATILVEGLGRASTDVLVRILRLDGSREVVRLTATGPSFIIADTPTSIDVAKTYFVFGVEHILKGVDHLFFVACLLFIAGSWPRILGTITGFTLAHSVTLTLAALKLVQIPVPPVEAVISLSIVFLAREIVRNRTDTLTWRYPMAISMIFGLLHGLGFASALSDIGLPQTEIPAALFAFNVGVEIGQTGFVAVLLAMVYFAKKSLKRVALIRFSEESGGSQAIPDNLLRWLEKTIAYGIGGVAMLWMIERIVAFWS
jgi:hydrogenase/urease accessory protein HupE